MSHREIEGRCAACGRKDIICPSCSPSGWVDVTEEQPPEYKVVLVLNLTATSAGLIRRHHLAYYLAGHERWWDGSDELQQVTHWMELPAPPVEE